MNIKMIDRLKFKIRYLQRMFKIKPVSTLDSEVTGKKDLISVVDKWSSEIMEICQIIIKDFGFQLRKTIRYMSVSGYITI